MFIVKTVWAAEQIAGGKRPAIVVIASVYECLSGFNLYPSIRQILKNLFYFLGIAR